MLSPGISVQPDCSAAFQDLALRRKHRYVVYSLTQNMREIQLLKSASRDSDFNDLVDDILGSPDDTPSCRYAAFDADLTDRRPPSTDNIVLILWCPENAKIKEKMMYASCKSILKKTLYGLTKEIQASDRKDLLLSKVLSKLL